MIRIRTDEGWLLFPHPEHARLAGEFALHWRNEHFLPPEPFDEIQHAVAHHDDAWDERDRLPLVTAEGLPSAFSRELVGTYDAFEEIDLADYLKVRGAATEAAAGEHPYAAILISMHTVNLLTEQADLSTLSEADRAVHAAFIDGQRARQCELAADLADNPLLGPATAPAVLDRAFRFLQACDSLSLMTCVRYDSPLPLRHHHPTTDGDEATITCTPLGADRYALGPYPFDEDELTFTLRGRRVNGHRFDSHEALQAAYACAPEEPLTVTLQRA